MTRCRISSSTRDVASSGIPALAIRNASGGVKIICCRFRVRTHRRLHCTPEIPRSTPADPANDPNNRIICRKTGTVARPGGIYDVTNAGSDGDRSEQSVTGM